MSCFHFKHFGNLSSRPPTSSAQCQGPAERDLFFPKNISVGLRLGHYPWTWRGRLMSHFIDGGCVLAWHAGSPAVSAVAIETVYRSRMLLLGLPVWPVFWVCVSDVRKPGDVQSAALSACISHQFHDDTLCDLPGWQRSEPHMLTFTI